MEPTYFAEEVIVHPNHPLTFGAWIPRAHQNGARNRKTRHPRTTMFPSKVSGTFCAVGSDKKDWLVTAKPEIVSHQRLEPGETSTPLRLKSRACIRVYWQIMFQINLRQCKLTWQCKMCRKIVRCKCILRECLSLLFLEGHILTYFSNVYWTKRVQRKQLQPFFLVATWAFLSQDFLISIEDDMAGGFPSSVPEHDKTLKAPTISQSNTGMFSCFQMNINQKNWHHQPDHVMKIWLLSVHGISLQAYKYL